jgi:hypothetical protein
MSFVDAHNFNLQLRREAEKITIDDQSKFLRAVALKALTKFIKRTPVLTGRLKGNWQVGVNDEPEHPVETEDKPGGTTIAKGNAQIAQAGPYSVIYIVNNLPYASFIENGGSKKEPAGMVKVSLEELSAELGFQP